MVGASAVNITDTVLLLSNASLSGGAVAALEGSSVFLRNSRLENNTAVLVGGSVCARDSVVTMDHDIFAGNAVTAGR